MTQRITSPIPYKEYQISASTTHSSALQLAYANPQGRQRLIVEAVSQRIFFAFGSDNTVEADATITSSVGVDGNFSVPAGVVMEVDVPGNLDWVSVEAAASTGTAVIKLCNADR